MIEVTQEILNNMVIALVKEMHPKKIFLFGSYASGKNSKDSDLDFLIIQDNGFKNRLREIKKARQALASFRIPKDILIYNKSEFDKWKNSPNHVIGTCLKEGKVLYERSYEYIKSFTLLSRLINYEYSTSIYKTNRVPPL